MNREIGSEFWIESIPIEKHKDIPNWIEKFGNFVLTSSGRGALSLLLQEVQPKLKTVLLPAYICDSVILPFVKKGYKCYFYDVNKDMTPNLERIDDYNDIGIFLHMGYYGFPTNNEILDSLKKFKAKSTIIVEDVTHSLFSDYYRFEENDYYIGSIRKWTGLPSGGLLASPHKVIKSTLGHNDSFANIRKEALLIKSHYIANSDKTLRIQYLGLFSKAEDLLDIDLTQYHIDVLSKLIINELNVVELKEKRIENFMTLSEGLKATEYFDPVFTGLQENICPLFYPVYINKSRNEVRNYLKEQKIYCPIHWPIPEQIQYTDYKNATNIYNTVLSIPCDQRYGLKDMERVISMLRDYKCKQ